MDKKKMIVYMSLVIGTFVVIAGLVLIAENSLREKTKGHKEAQKIYDEQLGITTQIESRVKKIFQSSNKFWSCSGLNKIEWTETYKVSSYNTGTSINGRIKNWTPINNDAKHGFKLDDNGEFEMEKGIYQIYAMVTFETTEKSTTRLPVFDFSNDRAFLFSLKTQSKSLKIADFAICVQVAKNQCFKINVEDSLLIHFFPKKTYLQITKIE